MMLLASTFPVMAQVQDERDPATIISETMTAIFNTLEEQRSEFTAKPELLRPVVREQMLPMIDLEYSARLILGRAGKGASAEQLTAFSQALSTMLINRYSDGLLDYRSDSQAEVLPLKGKNSDKLTRVQTRFSLNRGGYTPVDYAFHKTGEGWKAFDVTVEGISYVLTFRNQLSPRVASDGIDKVTADLNSGGLAVDIDE